MFRRFEKEWRTCQELIKCVLNESSAMVGHDDVKDNSSQNLNSKIRMNYNTTGWKSRLTIY